MRVLPEKRKELGQTLHSIVLQMKEESGCLESSFYQNAENENDFLIVEFWENRDALDDHLQSVRFTVLMGVRSLLTRPAEIILHTVSHSSKLESERLNL